MNKKCWTKFELYQNIDSLLDCMDIQIIKHSYPLDSKKIANTFCHNPTIETVMFPTTMICGMLIKEEVETVIVLNGNRDDTMQNFDCMHELIHYFFHDYNEFNCICTETTQIKQDRYIEWQANEGAAQALVPYQIIIPMYIDLARKNAKEIGSFVTITKNIAQYFNVSPKVITNRINNLNFEIYQYLHGIPINMIKILSKSKIDKHGLNKYEAEQNYCTNCLSIVNKNDNYCSVCGINLKEETSKYFDFRTLKGVGYMVYDKWELDQNSKAIYCPRCKNSEIDDNAKFCKICGINIINKCCQVSCEDSWNNHFYKDGCDAPAQGNARFCIHCGGETTFFRDKLLQPWHEEYKLKTSNNQNSETPPWLLD